MKTPLLACVLKMNSSLFLLPSLYTKRDVMSILSGTVPDSLAQQMEKNAPVVWEEHPTQLLSSKQVLPKSHLGTKGGMPKEIKFGVQLTEHMYSIEKNNIGTSILFCHS